MISHYVMYSSGLRGFCTLYKKRQSLNKFFFLWFWWYTWYRDRIRSIQVIIQGWLLYFYLTESIWCIHLKTSVKKKLNFILTSEVYVRYIVSVLQAFILQCKIWVIEDFFFEQTALVSSFYQAHVCQENSSELHIDLGFF